MKERIRPKIRPKHEVDPNEWPHNITEEEVQARIQTRNEKNKETALFEAIADSMDCPEDKVEKVFFEALADSMDGNEDNNSAT